LHFDCDRCIISDRHQATPVDGVQFLV
jgi:hypothetical protein